MLKITLLITLYYEFDHLLSRDGHDYEHRDKRFRTIHKTYPGIPEIASVWSSTTAMRITQYAPFLAFSLFP